ncbi:MAG TPA: FAD-dependent monooxygenase [Xanthobacteraceae bacterium]|nr:FAD-dependent monooxygenase [Xanthobacteraceae bacterium]
MVEETFVLIVGGGPVGLTAAITLGCRGIPAILVNERLETATHPKCNSTNARSMEHFRRLGAADDIQKAALPPSVAMEYAYVTRFCGYEFGRGKRPSPYIKDGKLQGGTPDFLRSPEQSQYIPQTRLEPVLKQHAEMQQSVSVRFGWKLTSFVETSTQVIAQVENVTTGEKREIKANYLFAADGARSVVRRQLGIDMAGDDGTIERAFMSGTMLSSHIRAPNLVKESGRPPAIINWITNNDVRGFMFAQDENTRWIVHYQVPHGVDWRTVDLQETVRKMLGADTEFEILSSGPWTGGVALIAERYQTARIFLAGDAAHLFTPLGALGMNTGIGDAINICWKLAAVHDGWAGEDLLASYEIERHPIGLRNSKHGINCARKQSAWPIPPNVEDAGPEADVARKKLGEYCVEDDKDQYNTVGIQLGERYEDSPIIFGEDTPAPPDQFHGYVALDRAGARLPHFLLADGTSLYAALGLDFSLIAFGDTETSSFEIGAAARNMPLKVLRVPERPEPYENNLVLVRPDQHIAWHGQTAPRDPAIILDRIRGTGAETARPYENAIAR